MKVTQTAEVAKLGIIMNSNKRKHSVANTDKIYTEEDAYDLDISNEFKKVIQEYQGIKNQAKLEVSGVLTNPSIFMTQRMMKVTSQKLNEIQVQNFKSNMMSRRSGDLFQGLIMGTRL